MFTYLCMLYASLVLYVLSATKSENREELNSGIETSPKKSIKAIIMTDKGY